MNREQRKAHRMLFVLEKIAKLIDQNPKGILYEYRTADPVEYMYLGLEKDEKIPNPADEVQILQLFQSEGILKIKSNHSEYE